MPTPVAESTIFFVCDLQAKFRPAIYGFDQVISTANKLVKLAKILGIEVVSTTQYAQVLGPVDPRIELESLGPLHLGTIDKTLFSMVVPEIIALLDARPHIKSVVIFGIEAQICVLQTALSLLALPKPYIPYIIADGTSSANPFELPIFFDRVRQEGATVTTSESLGYLLVGSSLNPNFKAYSKLVKDTKEETTKAGQVLLLGKATPEVKAPEPEVEPAPAPPAKEEKAEKALQQENISQEGKEQESTGVASALKNLKIWMRKGE